MRCSRTSYPSIKPFCRQTGKTALAIAAANGHVEAVRLLVSRGADVTAQDQVNRGGICNPARCCFRISTQYAPVFRTALYPCTGQHTQATLPSSAFSLRTPLLTLLPGAWCVVCPHKRRKVEPPQPSLSQDGAIPLHYAVRGGHEDAAGLLLADIRVDPGAQSDVRRHLGGRRRVICPMI